MRKEFRICKNGTSQTFGTYSQESDAEKKKEKLGHEYFICEYNLPSTPAELAASNNAEYEPIDGLKPYSHGAIVQERNVKAFESLQQALADLCEEYTSLESDNQRMSEDAQKIQDILKFVSDRKEYAAVKSFIEGLL